MKPFILNITGQTAKTAYSSDTAVSIMALVEIEEDTSANLATLLKSCESKTGIIT